MGFSETIAACDLKIDRCRQLIENASIQGEGYFFTLAQGHFDIKIKIYFLINHWTIYNQMLYVSFFKNTKKNENLEI